jgi:predicted SpoU family rRNA methylase
LNGARVRCTTGVIGFEVETTSDTVGLWVATGEAVGLSETAGDAVDVVLEVTASIRPLLVIATASVLEVITNVSDWTIAVGTEVSTSLDS